LVFVLAIVPGFVALTGYRFGRAVPAPADGLVAIAQVITLSLVLALAIWPLGGRTVYGYARSGTALTAHQADTYELALLMLIGAALVGAAAGHLVDRAADLVRERLLQSSSGPRATRVLEALSARLLTDGPSTWDRSWREIRRIAARRVGYVYVRIRTKSGNVIVGAVGRESRVALSPQPRDLYVEQVLRETPSGEYYPTVNGLGVLVAGDEIESIEWVHGS
jgi:hypothetical protein